VVSLSTLGIRRMVLLVLVVSLLKQFSELNIFYLKLINFVYLFTHFTTIRFTLDVLEG